MAVERAVWMDLTLVVMWVESMVVQMVVMWVELTGANWAVKMAVQWAGWKAAYSEMP